MNMVNTISYQVKKETNDDIQLECLKAVKAKKKMGVAGAIEINKLQFVRQLLSLLGTFDTKLHKVWINRKRPCK